MEPTYPHLSERIQSTFIDYIFIVIVMFVAASVFEKFENLNDSIRIAFYILLFFAYEPLCTAFGATIGNYSKGIRVRHITDSTRRINLLQAFVRSVVKGLLGWLSFLTINTNPKRRAIHDFIAGSVMIRK